jgi:hypothetical protein
VVILGLELDAFFDVSRQSTLQYFDLITARLTNRAQGSFIYEMAYAKTGIANASIRRSLKGYDASIDEALPIAIFEFSNFCFSQSDFFPKIGETASEVSPEIVDGIPPGVRLLLLTLEHGADANLNSMPQFAPIDPHRAAAAHYLTLLMMRFVWFHELAHGILGHVDFLIDQSGGGVLGLNELNMSELSVEHKRIDSRILQCMEFEADSWAMAKSIGIQHEELENIEGIASMPKEVRLRLSLFGVYAITWLLETLAGSFKRGRLNITHPAPMRRMQMLQNMAVWELNDLGLDADYFARSTLTQFESVLSQIGKRWIQTDRFDPVSYRDVFERMRDGLEPYRYVMSD